MQSKKKMIVNTVFLVVIFALTIYGGDCEKKSVNKILL